MSERLSAGQLKSIRNVSWLGSPLPMRKVVLSLCDHIDAITAENAELRRKVEAAEALNTRLQEFWDASNDNGTDDSDGWWERHDASIDALLAAQDAFDATATDEEEVG